MTRYLLVEKFKKSSKKNTLGGLVFRSFLSTNAHQTETKEEEERKRKNTHQRHTEDTQTLPLSFIYKKT
jgi:hypothetical protein